MHERVTKPDLQDALATYFHELAEHDVLTPEDEVRLARAIEDADIAVWEKLLSYAPAAAHVASLVETCLENTLPELKALRRAASVARKTRTKADQGKLAAVAARVAPAIRSVDADHRFRDVVLGEIRRLASAPARASRGRRLGFSPRAKAFTRWVAEVGAAERAAQRAREAFINANLRLVVSVARRYYQGGLSLGDLIQEGNLGLMKAVERFDYRRGFRFSTYATWWIRHTVGRALANKGNAVRIPVHLSDTVQRVAKVRRELHAKLDREPSQAEIAEAAGLSVARLETIQRQVPRFAISLDARLGDDESAERLEIFRDPTDDEPTPFDVVAVKADAEQIRSLMGELKPVEHDVLRQRFGLDGSDERTLQQIADQYELSRERIRQIQQEALGKLRRAITRSEQPGL